MSADLRKIRFWWQVGKGVGRFVLGRNGVLTGARKTDATFWRPATRSLDPSGTALRWEMMRGAARLAYRFGTLYLLALTVLVCAMGVLGFSPARLLWLHVGVALTGLAVYAHVRITILYGYRIPVPARRESLAVLDGEETVRLHWGLDWIIREGRKDWEREKVIPVALAVAAILSVSWTVKQRRARVRIPRDYREPGGSKVEILLPEHFGGADQRLMDRLVKTVAGRLGIRDAAAEWSLEGSTPRVLIGTAPAPPPLVTFEEVRQYFEASEPYTPFYGIAAGGQGLHIGMHSDTPHLAISAGSGAGKSEMIKVLVMQALRWGWSVIILDWKEESQEWAKGLRGVRYYSTEEAIHDAGIAIGEEISHRKANPDPSRRPILVVCEEWSMTADLLSEYWSILRGTTPPEERALMPVRSPALTAFKKMIFTGRSLGMFQLLVAIRFSARVTGGNADLRESFQVILMARYKQQTVNMLARGIKPFPKNRPREVGRWVAVIGEEVVVFRAPLVTDEEAREWAEGGVECLGSPWAERGNLRPELRVQATLGAAEAATETAPALPRGLADMLEGLRDIDMSLTLKVLRKAAGDHRTGFPEMRGVGRYGAYLYDESEVKTWVIKRATNRRAATGRETKSS